VSIKNDEYLAYSVSFWNVSAEPVCVPSFLLGGLGFFWHEIYDKSGKKLPIRWLPNYINGITITKIGMTMILESGEIKSEMDGMPIKTVFRKPGRYRVVFNWKGYLDDKREGEPKHFTCERWIKVTK
jgi:hypothetical protein